MKGPKETYCQKEIEAGEKSGWRQLCTLTAEKPQERLGTKREISSGKWDIQHRKWKEDSVAGGSMVLGEPIGKGRLLSQLDHILND